MDPVSIASVIIYFVAHKIYTQFRLVYILCDIFGIFFQYKSQCPMPLVLIFNT